MCEYSKPDQRKQREQKINSSIQLWFRTRYNTYFTAQETSFYSSQKRHDVFKNIVLNLICHYIKALVAIDYMITAENVPVHTNKSELYLKFRIFQISLFYPRFCDVYKKGNVAYVTDATKQRGKYLKACPHSTVHVCPRKKKRFFVTKKGYYVTKT